MVKIMRGGYSEKKKRYIKLHFVITASDQPFAERKWNNSHGYLYSI